MKMFSQRRTMCKKNFKKNVPAKRKDFEREVLKNLKKLIRSRVQKNPKKSQHLRKQNYNSDRITWIMQIKIA